MKNRSFVMMISAFTVVILIFSVLLGVAYRKLKFYEQNENDAYSKNLNVFNSALSNINLLLTKASYTESQDVMGSFVNELYSESLIAKDALVKLSETVETKTLERFLSQVENYALSVSKSIIKGENLNQNQHRNLNVLTSASNTVLKVVSSADSQDENYIKELEKSLALEENSSLEEDLYELEENITDYPELVYEGPYSTPIITKNAIFLENKPIVTVELAEQKLKTSFSLKEGNLKYSGDANGKIEGYKFADFNTHAIISKKGGYPVYYLKSREVKENKIDCNKAVLNANEVLKNSGYKNMQNTYHYIENGVCVINFAFLDGQTLCYTDLVKVGIALDNGELIYFDATGYLFNHTERAFKTPTYTAEEARQKLNLKLYVKDVKIALIPTEQSAEKRCYEFLCHGDNNEEMLVYINVNTLDEEQIFILIKNNNGIKLK